MSLTIAIVLHEGRQQLLDVSDTALLDAEILLAKALNVSRSFLFTFPERVLTLAEKNIFENFIEQRKQAIPIAYIIGRKEFWSLDLIVTRDTLIPRPETELLVERVLQEEGIEKIIADLGTGSGAIAVSIAHERPFWKVHATDLSVKALDVAKLNAAQLNVTNVIFHQGNWIEALPSSIKFDVIVSNPPYIAADAPDLENLKFEPKSALVAKNNGLHDISCIIRAAKPHLKPGGKLMLEHGCEQASEIRRIFENLGYSDRNTYQDLAGLDRMTVGVA
ncbi:MAG TPA: peptide chain release factor N(5)-glutamine methyltransferase [Gammaproteobacteria bacterium]|nr:peptide chain release factor N(5)-glutamine methyltransferase [Gammaproteobacteria bacterium]